MLSIDMLCLNSSSSSSYSTFISNVSSNSQRRLSQLPPPKATWSHSCLHLRSDIQALAASSSSITSRRKKKKKYGGVLPSILRSLELRDDVENTLDTFGENLSPKEQTIILKEQRSWERLIRVFDWFKSQKEYVPNVIHYNVVIRALGKAQRWDELRLCWIEMAKSGVLPANDTYSTLIDVYGKAGLVKEALLWVKHMRVRGYFPDEVTMSTVVKVLKDAREFDVAEKFYKSWCDGRVEIDFADLEDSLTGTVSGSGPGSGSIPLSFNKHFLSTELFKTGGRIPASNVVASSNTEKSPGKPRDTSTYNILIDLYGKAGRLKDAAGVFSDMLKSGVAMDAITFNTMIYICGSRGDLLEAESLLGKMEERGISPDTKTYNIFLSLYVNVGNIDAALSCYRRIRDAGLFPDDVTYRALLRALCEQNMVQAVEALMDEMKNSRVSLDEHSLPGIIKMYVNEGALDKAKDLLHNYQINGGLSSKICIAIMDVFAEQGLWSEAENIFARKRDIVGQGRDVAEYNVMIKAYGISKLYDKAVALFKGMRNQGTWPDECTYNSIIQMLSGADLVDQARGLLTEMLRMKIKPSCQTFSAVIGCYAHLGQLTDAVNVYQEMLQVGIKPNEVVYGSLINGFAECGSLEEALEYFQKMEESGIAANLIVLTSLLKAYCKIGSLEGAKAIYERMKDLEGGLDRVACNSMIGLFADFGMVSEAKLVFEHLREKGWADGVSYATMMYLYRDMSMVDDALEIAEEMKLSGLLKDCVSYNQVLMCYASNGKLRECGELLHQMISQNFSPNEGTFIVLFTALKKIGFPIEAVAQFESSYRDGKPYAQQAAITALYSGVGMHALAQESAQAFTEPGAALDSFAYNVAIYYYGSAGDVDKALNVYMKMLDEGVEPDIVTYINLVYCYGKARMVEAVKRIHSQLKYGEIEPSESLFKAIIWAYTMADRPGLAEMASQEMRLMLNEGECSENEEECSETETEEWSETETETETEDESDEASLGP